MATVTTLGFSIRSSFDPSGTRGATRALLTVGAVAQATSTRFGAANSAMGGMVTAAAALAPALAPIATVAAGVGAATTAMAVSSGSALGIYGLAMSGAIKRTMEMQAAGKALAPTQQAFVTHVNAMKGAWDKFVASTSPTTLRAATTVVQGITAGIQRLKPVVDAVAPSIQRVADAFKNWAAGEGFQRFINVIIQNGVPALNSLLKAGRDVLAVLGIGFRTFAPEGVKVAQALERGAAALRRWGEGGGFQRFLTSVQNMGPSVGEFFRALGQALGKISQAMAGLGPLSLGLATGLLQIVAALPVPVIQAMVVAFVAWRAAMLGMMIITTIVTIVNTLRTAIIALRSAWFLLSIAFSSTPLGLIITLVAAVVAGIVYLATQTQFFQTVWNAVWNGIKIAFNATTAAISAAWRAVVGGILTAWNTTSGALKTAWNAVWSWLRNTFETIIHQIQNWWNQFTNFIRNTWNAFAGIFKTAWQATWNWLRDTFERIIHQVQDWFKQFTNFIRNTWNAFASAFKTVWNAVWSWLRDTFERIIHQVQDWFKQFTNFIKNTWNAFAALFKTAWNAVWTWLRDTFERIIHQVQDWFKQFTNFIKNTWDDFTAKIKKAWSATWNALKDTAKKIWHEIGEIIEKAINGVISIVNGLIKGFNKITSFLKIDVKVGEIGKVNFNFAKGGMVPVQPYAVGGIAGMEHFAKGGVLRGYSPGRDTVPAMLSPGEGILTPEAVRGLGGPGFVHSANKTFAGHRGAGRGAGPLHATQGVGFSTGGLVQHFAVGGMVMDALGRAGLSGVTITQGEYSNGSLSAGTHTGGGVIDIAAGPDDGWMVAALRAAGFAAWLRTPAEGFAYHIHAVLMNHPDLSSAARSQVASYLSGGNGLANGGPDTGMGIDIFGIIKDNVGKILANVYKGAQALAGIGGGIADFFGMGGDDDEGNGGLFGTGIGPDFGPDVVKGAGDIAENVMGIGGGLAGMLGQMVLSFLDKGNIAEGLSDAKDKFGAWGKIGGGMGDIALGFGKKILESVMPDFLLKKKEENPFNMADFAGAFGSGGTQQWAPMAAMALQMAGLSANQLPAFLALMAAESGGNPMAINNYDSNAAMGQASRGLMQVIPATFAAYHVPGTSNNIFDPLANMAAAANYIKHVYGGNVPGSPYAGGTNNASRGWHLVGEQGPEMRYFRGGERVANARATQRALSSGTGGIVFEKGAFQIDARGATVEAVREMENNLVPKLRLAVQAGVGKKG